MFPSDSPNSSQSKNSFLLKLYLESERNSAFLGWRFCLLPQFCFEKCFYFSFYLVGGFFITFFNSCIQISRLWCGWSKVECVCPCCRKKERTEEMFIIIQPGGKVNFAPPTPCSVFKGKLETTKKHYLLSSSTSFPFLLRFQIPIFLLYFPCLFLKRKIIRLIP